MCSIKCCANIAVIVWFISLLHPSYTRMIDIVRDDGFVPEEWDSLIFTVQWPITTCMFWKEGKPDHSCILPQNPIWTVHGIWPTRTGTEGPFFCNRTWIFDPNGVTPVRQDLLLKWPNIHGGDTEDSLWKHEWEKHGTCAALDEHFSSELLYFGQGIKWVNLYEMGKILAKNKIFPSTTSLYNVSAITTVLKDEFGAIPIIGCEYDKETKLIYIAEIRLCFGRDRSLINCNHNHRSRVHDQIKSVIDCPISKLISYPDYGSFKKSMRRRHRISKHIKKRNQLKQIPTERLTKAAAERRFI